MNSFKRILSNPVHGFWKERFFKPELLLAVKRLIYLDISIGYQKFPVPSPRVSYHFT